MASKKRLIVAHLRDAIACIRAAHGEFGEEEIKAIVQPYLTNPQKAASFMGSLAIVGQAILTATNENPDRILEAFDLEMTWEDEPTDD